MFVVLFFSLVVWLVSTTTFSLFSFSLRCWGNPNPFSGVWVSPCVSSSLDADFVLDPYLLLRILHLGFAPAPCFFFFSALVVGVSLVWWSLLVLFGFVWSVWVCCLSVVCLCMSALHARCLMHRVLLDGAEGDNHLPPPGYDHYCNVLGIGVRTECPVHTMHRLGLTPPPPPPPTPFLPNAVKDSPGRGWGKIGHDRQPYCHTLLG